jgi:antitoxin component YwqK of YwqJK toxin-antitoxin module
VRTTRYLLASLGAFALIGCSDHTPELIRVMDAQGKLVAEVTQEEGIKNGPARFFHANGSLMKYGNYIGDLKQGPWVFHAVNGHKTAELSYLRGRLDGTCRWWDANGQLIAEEPYEQGIFHGTLRRWFPDGSPKQETHFEHGRAFGEYTRHVHEGDTLRHGTVIKGFYADGKCNGIWTGLTGDGRLMSEGRFVDNIRVGTWRYWDRQGRLVKEVDYENGSEKEVRDLSSAE